MTHDPRDIRRPTKTTHDLYHPLRKNLYHPSSPPLLPSSPPPPLPSSHPLWRKGNIILRSSVVVSAADPPTKPHTPPTVILLYAPKGEFVGPGAESGGSGARARSQNHFRTTLGPSPEPVWAHPWAQAGPPQNHLKSQKIKEISQN